MEAGQTFRYVRDAFFGSTSLDTYERMNREAEASPPGASGVKAYLGPRLANYRHLKFDIPGGFVAPLPPAPGSASRGDYTRAALEAVAYGVRLNVERLERVSGQDVSVLRVSGGLSQSGLLMQIMADLIGVRITVPVNKEASALGAAVCAGVGAGVFESMAEGADRLVRWDQQLEPAPERSARYRELFEDWKTDYHKMYGAETLLE
jgi:autoinducer 2 (AI-2) kinase